jgi:O-antigen ligase
MKRTMTMSMRAISLRLSRTNYIQRAAGRLRLTAVGGFAWLTALMLVASVLLGGGTRSGFLSDVLLQLFAIPLLLLSVSRLSELLWRHDETWRPVQWELMFCLALALLPLFQLVPLPPWLWTLLPHRAPEITAFEDAGQALPWMPISVSPNDTWRSVPALLPPFAIFLATLLAGYRERRILSLAVIALGVVSAFLGLLQVAQGTASPLRFFAFTNLIEAVGFFANRNHLAALLYVALLFAAAWAIDIGFKTAYWRDRRLFEARSMMAVTGSFLAMVILLSGEAMARSRAGMILTMASLAGAYALVISDRRRTFNASSIGLLLAAVGTSFVLAVQFALYRILERFGADPLDDVRVQFVRNTVEAAKAYLPFGSGIGTFVPVYEMFEKPGDLAAHVYVNHAHNDIVEVCLEAGIIGIALIGAFAAWFISRSTKIWRHGAGGADEFDGSLARAATMVVAVLIAHSFLDYPLRTAAIMGIFAFACGLMIEPLAAAERPAQRHAHIPAHAGAGRAVPAPLPADISATAAPPSVPSDQEPAVTRQPPRSPARWGEDVDWPAAWRKPPAGRQAGGNQPKPTPEEGEEK